MMVGAPLNTVVLGGTGFLGSHVAERLAVRDPDLTIVSRTGASVGHRSLDITAVDAGHALADLLGDAAIVVNLIGVLARPSLTNDLYTRLHVDGTQRIVDAMARAKAPRSRLIHVSTAGVL